MHVMIQDKWLSVFCDDDRQALKRLKRILFMVSYYIVIVIKIRVINF